MKLDLHLHTCYSPDATLSPERLIEACLQRGLDGIAVTDHNTIAGALAVRELAPFPVIVGEEIKTTRGEVLGLFLEAEVPRGLFPLEAVAAIRAQGGLVGVPHPLDRVRRSAMGERTLHQIIGHLDFIEAFNSRVILLADNRRAEALARQVGLPCTAGSDAHTAYEVGRAYLQMPPFEDQESFLRSLEEAEIMGQVTNPLIHLLTTLSKLYRRLER